MQKAAENTIHLRPVAMFTDFEQAAQNAARTVFNCNLKGCMFHYRQAIWRNAQKCGLQTLFNTDPSVNRLIRHASALPLIHPRDIDDVWLNALENADLDDARIVRFSDYVTEQWVEADGRLVWNHFHTIGSRTTNHLEGWHSKLNKAGPNHPNIFKFVDLIKKEQCHTETVLLQIQAGGRLAPKRRKTRIWTLESKMKKVTCWQGGKLLLSLQMQCRIW